MKAALAKEVLAEVPEQVTSYMFATGLKLISDFLSVINKSRVQLHRTFFAKIFWKSLI